MKSSWTVIFLNERVAYDDIGVDSVQNQFLMLYSSFKFIMDM